MKLWFFQNREKRRPYLCGVSTGGNVTDHKPTASLLWCVGITCMHKESIMNLYVKETKGHSFNIQCLYPHLQPFKLRIKPNSQTSVQLTEGITQLPPPAPAPLGSPGSLTACSQGGGLGDGATCLSSGCLQKAKLNTVSKTADFRKHIL